METWKLAVAGALVVAALWAHFAHIGDKPIARTVYPLLYFGAPFVLVTIAFMSFFTQGIWYFLPYITLGVAIFLAFVLRPLPPKQGRTPPENGNHA